MTSLPAPIAAAKAHKMGLREIASARSLRTVFVLLAMWAVLAVHPESRESFMTAGNFSNLTAQVSEIVIIGVGMTLVILIGGIDLSVGAGMAVAGVIAAKLQNVHHFAHLLILEQPAHELRARIVPLLVIAATRQQHLHLDAQQSRRHLEIFGCLAETQRVDAKEELLADARDGNVRDLDLLFADEREQQVERPREVLQLDDEWRRARVERRESGAHRAPSANEGTGIMSRSPRDEAREIVLANTPLANETNVAGSPCLSTA